MNSNRRDGYHCETNTSTTLKRKLRICLRARRLWRSQGSLTLQLDRFIDCRRLRTKTKSLSVNLMTQQHLTTHLLTLVIPAEPTAFIVTYPPQCRGAPGSTEQAGA